MTGRPHSEAELSPGDPPLAVIEDAYIQLNYPKPASTGVCDCCTNAQIQRDFFNPDIRQLPPAYVQDWFEGACQTSGVGKELWGYLLPRLFDLLASGQEPSLVSVEVVLSRFDTGNPANWSASEWLVIDRFQREFLRTCLRPQEEAFDGFLCMFRLGGWRLSDLLDQVAAFPTPLLASRLWNDWCKGHVPGREDIWLTAFWNEPDRSTVADFYTSPELRARFMAMASVDGMDRALVQKAMALVRIIDAHRAD